MEKSSDTGTMLAVKPPATAAEQELDKVNQQLQTKAVELQQADDPKDIARLTREVQRLRVAKLVLHEIVHEIADPTTYREMSLLNKMMTGRDLEEEAKLQEQAEGDEAAQARLREVGLNPDDAPKMVRALKALQSLMDDPHGLEPKQLTAPPDTVQ